MLFRIKRWALRSAQPERRQGWLSPVLFHLDRNSRLSRPPPGLRGSLESVIFSGYSQNTANGLPRMSHPFFFMFLPVVIAPRAILDKAIILLVQLQ